MEKDMLTDSDANAAARERLSALVDGELDGAALPQACAQWRENDQHRATWHAWHLIGDVLRSDDLAHSPARDAAFLASLRARLEREPVVLAPQPAAQVVGAAYLPADLPAHGSARVAARAGRRGWMAPSAVAAGFVAVAGVLTLMRPGVLPERTPAERIAGAASGAIVAPGAPVAVVAGAGSASTAPAPGSVGSQALVAGVPVIRDARLDLYLSAHKQFAGSSALGVPSAYLRNATLEASGR
jgi:sigma-E factor negative regulatory protein RseA